MTRTVPVALRSMSGTVDTLRSFQKPGAGVPAYTRWVNRYLGRYAAAAAFHLGLSANQVTLISATLSVAGIALLLLTPIVPLTGLLVSLLFVAGYALDSADGQVARLSRTSSPAGEWLDHVIDAVRTPATHLAVLVALSRFEGTAWIQIIAIAYALLSVGLFMSQILAEQLAGKPVPLPGDASAERRKSFLLLPTDTGTFCLMFVLWGFPPLFAIAYALMFGMNAVHTVISMWRKYRKLTSLHR
ncbi:MAG: CDP-alcohol phosphatidyltransferase [Mycetocola sp.]|jgi:phosphatidylglycerophosphate synthase|nr:CDP-alcohol phosphatidyltransferase [Mycetocola sp.]